MFTKFTKNTNRMSKSRSALVNMLRENSLGNFFAERGFKEVKTETITFNGSENTYDWLYHPCGLLVVVSPTLQTVEVRVGPPTVVFGEPSNILLAGNRATYRSPSLLKELLDEFIDRAISQIAAGQPSSGDA